MPKYSIMLARFPYLNQECPDSVDWMMRTVLKAKADPRISDVYHCRIDDTPITMGRNLACQRALAAGCDYLLMLDSDMKPDCEERDPAARPFWDTTLDFALSRRDEFLMAAAPYCGPPPIENVYVFQWSNCMNDSSCPDWRLEQFSREEAARLAGIQEVAALPTGLILLDVRVLKLLAPPWFYYEWNDHYESQKASTEDVTFTRDASLQGVSVYCNWDAWAGHWKRHLVRKPRPLSVTQMRQKYELAVREQLALEQKSQRLKEVPPGGFKVQDLLAASDGPPPRKERPERRMSNNELEGLLCPGQEYPGDPVRNEP